MADEIIEELWRIKDEIAREHGYNFRRLGEHLRSLEGKTAQDWLAGIEARANEQSPKEEPEDPEYVWDEFMQEYGQIKSSFTTERGFDSKGMMDYFLSLEGKTVVEWLTEIREDAQNPPEKILSPAPRA